MDNLNLMSSDIFCRWVGATSEFLSALHDSSYMHRQKVVSGTKEGKK